MTSLQPQFIFISGGYIQNGQFINAVERYDCMGDRWESLPGLNLARNGHSSCTLGKTLYVLGGKDDDDRNMNSIEKLANIVGQAPSAFSQWQLIQPI